MPFTRCSRASSSTSHLAVLLASRRCGLLGRRRAVPGGGGTALGRGRAVAGGRRTVPCGSRAVLGRSRAVLSGGRAILGRRAAAGGGGTGLGALGGPASARPLAVRLGRPAGRRLRVLGDLRVLGGVLGALGVLGVLGVCDFL